MKVETAGSLVCGEESIADIANFKFPDVYKDGYLNCKFALRTDVLDYHTPAENVEAFMKAARKYGQPPLKLLNA